MIFIDATPAKSTEISLFTQLELDIDIQQQHFAYLPPISLFIIAIITLFYFI